MAIDVIVIRDAGDIDGPPVTDPLIGSDACAIQRGRNILDGATRLVKLDEATILYEGNARLGMIHQLEDKEASSASKGKVIGVSHSVERSGDRDAVNIDTRLRTIGNTNV